MLRLFVPAVLIGVLVAAAALLGSDRPRPEGGWGAGPRIEAHLATLDFGEARYGDVVERSFFVKNTGDAPLEIVSVQASCGCTVAELPHRTIQPGLSGAVRVRFDTTRKSFVGWRKRFRSFFVVRSNARNEERLRLVLEGDVVTHFRVVPHGGAIFREAYVKGPTPPSATTTVEIYPYDVTSDALAQAALAYVPPGLRVGGPEPIPAEIAGTAVRLEVAMTADIGVGPIRDSIKLKLPDEELGEVVVPVYGSVLPSVKPSVPAVYVPLRTGRATLKLLATRPGDVLPRVIRSEVEPLGGAQAVELVPLEPQGRGVFHEVEVRVPEQEAERLKASDEAVPGRGVIRFLTDDVWTPVVSVTYRVIDQEARHRRTERARQAKVMLSPPDLELRTVCVGEQQQARVAAMALGERLDLREVEIVGAGLSVQAEEQRQGRAATLHITAEALAPGLVRGRLRFRPRPGQELLEVPIGGYVRRSLELSPEGVLLGPDRRAGEVRLWHYDLEPFRVVSARAADPRLKVAVIPLAGDRVRVLVEAAAGAEGPLDSRIEIDTDIEGEPTLEVPVFGRL